MSDLWKNRWSHSSHRYGLTDIMARTFRSKIPLRFDRWIRLPWHRGQFSIAILLLTHLWRCYPPPEQRRSAVSFCTLIIGRGGCRFPPAQNAARHRAIELFQPDSTQKRVPMVESAFRERPPCPMACNCFISHGEDCFNATRACMD